MTSDSCAAGRDWVELRVGVAEARAATELERLRTETVALEERARAAATALVLAERSRDRTTQILRDIAVLLAASAVAWFVAHTLK